MSKLKNTIYFEQSPKRPPDIVWHLMSTPGLHLETFTLNLTLCDQPSTLVGVQKRPFLYAFATKSEGMQPSPLSQKKKLNNDA